MLILNESSNNQVFQISPSVRVVADYEEYYDTIQQVCQNMGLGIQTLKVANNLVAYSTDDDAKPEIEEIVSDFTLVEDAVTDYFTDTEIPFLIYGLRGFSQGEWHEVVIYDTKKEWAVEGLKSVAEELDARFSGEVYRISVQYSKLFVAEDGDTRTQWITDEDLGYYEVAEKLFTLNADFIKETLGLEVQV